MFVTTAIDSQGPETLLSTGRGTTLAGTLKCDLLVIAVGMPLVGLGWAMSKGMTLARPALSGACVGLGAATWAHAVLRMHCPVDGASHAVVAHLLPAIPLMIMGAWAFRKTSHIPARRRS
ncbi:MAG: DUF1109 family protein [Deltaproteobacteria bacterium]|nr:DUF1109 family protein [Deltaproteobacteria bacterium]